MAAAWGRWPELSGGTGVCETADGSGHAAVSERRNHGGGGLGAATARPQGFRGEPGASCGVAGRRKECTGWWWRRQKPGSGRARVAPAGRGRGLRCRRTAARRKGLRGSHAFGEYSRNRGWRGSSTGRLDRPPTWPRLERGMMDTVTRKRRSEIMAGIRSKGMKPEMTVRRQLHSLGYRYRLHCQDLPGRPDLVFPARRKVIFVHGCFWHQHADPACKIVRQPKSNRQYWMPKLKRNLARDAENRARLRELGWGVLVIWECEVRTGTDFVNRAREYLDGE